MIRPLLSLGLLACAAMVLALGLGSVTVPLPDLWQVVQGEGSALNRTLLMDLRLPRTMAAER
jgi:iron complex transport system permease protein